MPFNRLPPKVRTKISTAGANALHEQGKAYKMTPQKAREAAETRWRNKRLRDQKEEAERE